MQRSRRVLAMLLVPVVMVLSSCARIQSAVTIKDEQHIPMHVKYGLQSNVAYNAKITPEKACGLITPGQNGIPADATAKPYNETDYLGCELDFTTTMQQLNSGTTDPVLQHSGDRWTFHLGPDQAKQVAGAEGEGLDPAQISDFKIDVTFPGGVTSHNGSSTVKGNTVTWTDPKDFLSADGLKAESGGAGTAVVGGKAFPVLPAVIGGLVLLLLLGALLWFLLRRRRPRPPAAPEGTATVYQPGASGPGARPGYGQQPGFGATAEPRPQDPDSGHGPQPPSGSR